MNALKLSAAIAALAVGMGTAQAAEFKVSDGVVERTSIPRGDGESDPGPEVVRGQTVTVEDIKISDLSKPLQTTINNKARQSSLNETNTHLNGVDKRLKNAEGSIQRTKAIADYNYGTNKEQSGLIHANTDRIQENTKSIKAVGEEISDVAEQALVNSYAILDNDYNIGVNKFRIDDLSSDVERNLDLIDHNYDDISVNKAEIATNASDIIENTSNINLNKRYITSNANFILKNSENIVTNTRGITKNTAFILEDRKNITANKTNIATNTANISSNTDRIVSLEQDVDELRSGVAMAVAIANAPVLQGGKNGISVSGGFGHFKGKAASALKVAFLPTENMAVTASVATDFSNNVTAGAGLGFSF
ncbi:YadA C-terminal domain-containing protein [Pseudovibrio sp. WM33]|uniref:YadA C-terminal domain-containing protein n=1 Tax=Pseudovibrio sp. WM33 TaxID=1735585 RepID=UPI0007B1BE22|nr:YadA C-terminal domain-containing protein [Pseudovibrio sp. WM33]KZL27421.1 hypothetical protein PsWM33_00930 [Pseudovibrio sp. WM33]